MRKAVTFAVRALLALFSGLAFYVFLEDVLLVSHGAGTDLLYWVGFWLSPFTFIEWIFAFLLVSPHLLCLADSTDYA